LIVIAAYVEDSAVSSGASASGGENFHPKNAKPVSNVAWHFQRSSDTTPEWRPPDVDEGSVSATAKLTRDTKPLDDVHDDGLYYYNRTHVFKKAKTAEALRKQVVADKGQDDGTGQFCGTAASTNRIIGRNKAKTSSDVVQAHHSDTDDRQAINEMMNNAGGRRTLGILVEDNLVVHNAFAALENDIVITHTRDVSPPPLPPPVEPPDLIIDRVDPSEPLSLSDHVGEEMLAVPPALNNNTTPEVRAITHVPTE
jgi:hypothetical protein